MLSIIERSIYSAAFMALLVSVITSAISKVYPNKVVETTYQIETPFPKENANQDTFALGLATSLGAILSSSCIYIFY